MKQVIRKGIEDDIVDAMCESQLRAKRAASPYEALPIELAGCARP